VREFRASVGLPTDEAVIDWLMTQWAIGLRIYETDEEDDRIAPLEAAVEAGVEARCGRTRSAIPRVTREPGRSTSTERPTCVSASPASSPRTVLRSRWHGSR